MPKVKYIRPPDAMERNRVYAKNRRQMKKEYILSLEKEIAELKLENSQLHEILGWLSKKP